MVLALSAGHLVSWSPSWVGFSPFGLSQIPVLQGLPFGYRMNCIFCITIISTAWQGICNGYLCSVCCCIILWKYFNDNGLDLVNSFLLPLTQNDYWKWTAHEVLKYNTCLQQKIDGCRVKSVYAGCCVAPNYSEQPMTWSLRYCRPSIKKSMMTIIKTKTSHTLCLQAARPALFCRAPLPLYQSRTVFWIIICAKLSNFFVNCC